MGTGALIWDVYAAHFTPKVRARLDELKIKTIYVPASKTSTRQPLDTHIFGPLKKRYQCEYYNRVFIEKEEVKQLQAIIAYNAMMKGIEKKHIVNAFREAILEDAKSVISKEDDPNPDPKAADGKDEEKEDEEDDSDELDHDRDEDLPTEESSEDEIPEQMPSTRHPRTAQSVAYNGRVARKLQYNIAR